MARNGKNRAHFNARADRQDAGRQDAGLRRDPFLDALDNPDTFRAWLEHNDPSLEYVTGKVSLPRQRVKQKQRKGAHRKKVVKTVQNRQSRLLLALRAGHLPLLLAHFEKRGEKLDKATIGRAHQQGLPGVLAVTNRDVAHALIDHLYQNGEAVTRADLFLSGNGGNAPGRMPGTLSLGLIQYALGLNGDRLGRKDLMRHNNSGRTILAEMVKQGHGDLVIEILSEDTDRLSVQDLQTKRGQGKISILESLFTTNTPEIILRLPLRKHKYLSADAWQQLYANRLIYRLGQESDGLKRMERIARSPEWMKQPYAAFNEFCNAFDDRTKQKIGIPETRALYRAQRVKALHSRFRKNSPSHG